MTSSQETLTVEQVRSGDVVVLVEGDVPFEVVGASATLGVVRQLDVLPVRAGRAVMRLTVPVDQSVTVLRTVSSEVSSEVPSEVPSEVAVAAS
jgi:hypothetical protein